MHLAQEDMKARVLVSPGHRTMRKLGDIWCSSAQRVTGAPKSQHWRLGPTGRCWTHSPASVTGKGTAMITQAGSGRHHMFPRTEQILLSSLKGKTLSSSHTLRCLQAPTPQISGLSGLTQEWTIQPSNHFYFVYKNRK